MGNEDKLLASAQSVGDVAEFFAELKSRALSNPAVAGIVERGYLKPDEETELRQLQVSYWQGRNALLEIVAAHAHARPSASDLDPGDFLVAFAAAVTLVDAAFFLRVRFHGVAPIRAKLDEPDSRFGIPDRMYETVQHSLTCPHHVVRLLQARSVYMRGRRDLRRQFTAGPLAGLLPLIDRKITRLRPSAATYLRTRLHVWGQLVRTRIGRNLFGSGLFQIQKYVSSLMADRYVVLGHQPRLPADMCDDVCRRLQSGDVLVVRKEHAVTNYFLPGYWPHAALYLGTCDDLRQLGLGDDDAARQCWPLVEAAAEPRPGAVIEAMKDGVRIRPLESPLASDSIVVLRPQLESHELRVALARALAHEGKPYDFDFDFTRSHRLVCTEVVYRAYDGVGSLQFELTRQVGRLALAAEGLIDMALTGRGFDVVAVFSPADSDALLTGDDALKVLRARTPTS